MVAPIEFNTKLKLTKYRIQLIDTNELKRHIINKKPKT